MKKIICTMLLLVLTLCMAGCNKEIPYNATIIKEKYEFNAEFLIKNKTYGALLNDEVIDNAEYPKERMIIIDNMDSFNEIFNCFSTIDFDKEILLMHGFTTASNNEYKLKKINYENGKITIEYTDIKSNGAHAPNASQPDTKWVVVKLERINVNAVEFKYIA